MLHTDRGKIFAGKLIQEMCRLLSIDKTQTSHYKSKGNEQTDRHNAKMADVILQRGPKEMGHDVAVLELCVQHDSESDNGSYAVQYGAWRGVHISS